MSTRQQRIAELAKQAPSMAFTSLNHHMDLEWLREAHRRTRKDGAVGIDGQTAADYERDLENNLNSLLSRAKTGSYFAPPVKRVHIPKGPGTNELRPIGVPTFEDKILQRAVVMLLEPIYEQDFLNCSFGFRPGRSQHQALKLLWKSLMDVGGGWVLNIDIRKFFDTLDKAHLRDLLELRVRDGVVKRLIGKWLNAGVFENGGIYYPEAGSPQGGVISPLASNVYLHHVLDEWFEKIVRPKLKGRATLVRFADDALIVFADKADAERVMEVLPKRFAKYGLTLHPDKTHLVEFNRPSVKPGELGRDRRPATFDCLGFTHYWGASRKGYWVVKCKTADDRFNRGLKKISHWCRENRHLPIGEQHAALSAKLRGHYNYFGMIGNFACIQRYKMRAVRIWHGWLRSRSQRHHFPWSRFSRYLKTFPLPRPTIFSPTQRRSEAMI